ncbi:hypothetical protein A2631_02685 [Candidatus Daviesbacteria bacterium RIFCSPHIGHO2_01_FULL_44_29]|uniref:Glycosyl transferase family 1 domain-containing protein n=1 Tax=Candidatus Daviesbacteria bacterium RIFCSPHIGHO2_02_FULL_43_12 TaxID=1797776 RepID=A0A1F5KKZ5_9BACT|nr:MAG: hypothetical protein A2631_02685 [Candidatus Daviesbacteria bacterium RIFCSPHIGHO2_01_FULL_44_29]OGE40853.1 MAG: hypothetical protein A3E86_02665 [Candidatus Daviesbacteria bacterium RIFCSPHIGHO2_12_FULL_47_45]OGE41291.1 MAG: hypothetical protein A3D25_02080 [Candidatus Daviesbacteria bacterium RIFCSPHIGHO2_02_FULL_43_12]OGE69492.1 MAG: hypothetical protein A3B55_03820 [Candidatus Daviesbacteria bacterium RIFCSPLOWO2_01_FULL_43_15]
MNIGIDARLFGESGIGRYIRNLINELKKIDKQNSYFVFLLARDFEKFDQSENFKKIKADIPWYGFAEQIKLPYLIGKYKIDLMHFPHFNVPILYKGKFVVTIHDLIHQRFSMQRSTTHGRIFYNLKKVGFNIALSSALLKSEKIIVPSEFVKHDILNNSSVSADKIVVTLEGVEETFSKLASSVTEEEVRKVLEKFDIKPPFIFYLGNAHPHKNVEGLIECFLELRKKYQYLKLVLSGHDHYFWERLKSGVHHPDIIFTSFVSDKEMISLLKKASLRVIPSFEEGFGIPVLEAFAVCCPVACSDTSSLPEVAGEGAMYFNPYSTKDMSEKIIKMLGSDTLRSDLVKKGKKQLTKFSWKKMAEQTLAVYRSI